eukprot:3566653-Prymnesium_polylepis.1
MRLSQSDSVNSSGNEGASARMVSRFTSPRTAGPGSADTWGAAANVESLCIFSTSGSISTRRTPAAGVGSALVCPRVPPSALPTLTAAPGMKVCASGREIAEQQLAITATIARRIVRPNISGARAAAVMLPAEARSRCTVHGGGAASSAARRLRAGVNA